MNFIDDKTDVASKSLHRCTIVNETQPKRPLETLHNAINLLNEISNTHLQTLGVNDRAAVIVWTRKIIGKHNHMKNVQSKAEKMKQNVQSFKSLFGKLFQKALPSFWDYNGQLCSQEQYQVLLTQAHMDHSKFQDLRKGLNGNAPMEKLTDEFEILTQFKEMKAWIPPISYASFIELEVLIKDMVDYDIPSQNQWKEIYKLRNTKYKFLVDN